MLGEMSLAEEFNDFEVEHHHESSILRSVKEIIPKPQKNGAVRKFITSRGLSEHKLVVQRAIRNGKKLWSLLLSANSMLVLPLLVGMSLWHSASETPKYEDLHKLVELVKEERHSDKMCEAMKEVLDSSWLAKTLVVYECNMSK